MYQSVVQINNTQYNRQNSVKTLNKNRIKIIKLKTEEKKKDFFRLTFFSTIEDTMNRLS